MAHHIGKITGPRNPRLTGCKGDHLMSELSATSSGGTGNCVIVPISTDSVPSRWFPSCCSTRA